MDTYEDAYLYYQLGKYDLAEEKLLEVLQDLPLEKEVWFAYASSLQMQKKYIKAIKAWQTCTLLNPENIYCYLHAAECYISNGDVNKAKEPLTIALQKADTEAMKEKILMLMQRSETRYA
jgi:tetratricopeptide (TPR) repeat protein